MNTFKTRVAERKEKERVIAWSDLQRLGVLQLLSAETRDSRFGKCYLARSKGRDGDVCCWVPKRMLNEIQRRYKPDDTIYWISCGVECYRDKSVKLGDDRRSRNVYELELTKDEEQIPLSIVLRDFQDES